MCFKSGLQAHLVVSLSCLGYHSSVNHGPLQLWFQKFLCG
ncbi:hypothetical protein T09_4463 [Trichinella sp. T9]|nr:hypothetical protein T09_4463 [Trichinella sp. T9]